MYVSKQYLCIICTDCNFEFTKINVSEIQTIDVYVFWMGKKNELAREPYYLKKSEI